MELGREAVRKRSNLISPVAAGNEGATTFGIFGSPSSGWRPAGWDQPHHPWVPPLGLGVWQEKEPLLVVQDPLLRAVGVPLHGKKTTEQPSTPDIP